MVHVVRTDIDDEPWVEAQFGLLDRPSESKLVEFFGWRYDNFSVETNSCHGKGWKAIRNSRHMGLEVASYRYSVGGLVVRFREGSEFHLYTLDGVKLVLEHKKADSEKVEKNNFAEGQSVSEPAQVAIPVNFATAWNHLFALNFDIAKFRFSLSFSKKK